MNKRTQRTRPRKKGEPGIPSGSKYVGRPTAWGNIWRVGSNEITHGMTINIPNRRVAVMMYYAQIKELAESNPEGFKQMIAPLVGKDICCWCRLDEICHADILLFFANRFEQIDVLAKMLPNFDVFEQWLNE